MSTTTKKTLNFSIEARIDKLLDGERKTKAYASVALGGAFAVHGIRVIETENGSYFIAMPQDSYRKGDEKKYKDSFHAITAEARSALIQAVTQAYEQAREQSYSEHERNGMSM